MISRPPFTGVVLPLLLLLAAGGPAAAQNNNGLFGDLFKPPGQTAQEAQPPGPSAAELVVRMERLENALRTLTGQVEELQFRNQQLEAQIRRMEDAAGGPRPAAAPPMVPRTPTVVAPPAGKRSDVFDPAAEPGAPGAPQPLGSPTSASAGLVRPGPAATDMAVPGGAAAPVRPAATSAALGAGAAAAGAAVGGARELYDSGQVQFQRQDYAGAEQTFRQVLKTYPGDRIAPEATFMLGESLFLRRSYADAATSFLEVSTKYPNSTRGPEALLRLGQSLAGMGEKETACATFAEVDRKYPRAPSTVRQAVEREQKRAGC